VSGNAAPPAVLLDTCAVIWLANGDPLAAGAVAAIDASGLPGELHGDPGDRLIIATARHLGLPIVTRDSRIIAYAGIWFVTAIKC